MLQILGSAFRIKYIAIKRWFGLRTREFNSKEELWKVSSLWADTKLGSVLSSLKIFVYPLCKIELFYVGLFLQKKLSSVSFLLGHYTYTPKRNWNQNEKKNRMPWNLWKLSHIRWNRMPKQKHAWIWFYFVWLWRSNTATMPGFYPASHCKILITPEHRQLCALYKFPLTWKP